MEIFKKSTVPILVLAIIGLLIYLSTGELTQRETGLLSILLTILSIIATLIVSYIYSESNYSKALEEVKETYQSNLKTYALNAAEKVNNLSEQLTRLSMYLQEELDHSDYESENEVIRSREERIESSIHIINTLKSVNDTTLNDWKGVIKEELEEQLEEREEREEELMDMVERIQSLEERWEDQKDNLVFRHETADLIPELEKLRKELRLIVSGVTGTRVKSRKPRKQLRRTIEKNFPDCGASITYTQ